MNIWLRIKTGQRAKIRTAIRIIEVVVQLEPIALNDYFGSGSRLILTVGIKQVEIRIVRIDGCADHTLDIRRPVVVQFETSINTPNAIKESARLTIGVQQADRRLTADVAAN